jgi:DNA-binding YbaB/EbfC family protein
MFEKLKQIKDLRDKAKKIQEALQTVQVEGSAGWGKVKVVMDGNQQVVSVSIDQECMTPDMKEKLEGYVKEAIGDAVKKVQQQIMMKMKDMGELDLPGLS